MNKFNKIEKINPKKLGKILVIAGGLSKERDISLLTGKAAYQALKNQGCNVELLDWMGVSDLKKLYEMAEKNLVDRVFIALHGLLGEDGCIQGLLECLQIPYTGSGVLSSSLCMDKVYAKAVLRAHGLPVLDDFLLNKKTYDETSIAQIESKLGMPLCIKPVFEGSSLGVRKANNIDELLSNVKDLLEQYGDIMIERWIDGREITVGFSDNKALPIIEIEAIKNKSSDFYDYQAKYFSDETKYHCPANLSDSQENIITNISKKAFDILQCHDWARVDLILDNNSNSIYILEVNTIPGLTAHSLVPMGAKEIDLSFEELVLKIAYKATLKNKEKQANRGKAQVN
tara:strand:- start:13357 stop:14385 length:1029 start_codon:yes stop_codon:yes gene_type:complete